MTSRTIFPTRFERDLEKPEIGGAYLGRGATYDLLVRSGGRVAYALRCKSGVSVVGMNLIDAIASAEVVPEVKLPSITHRYTGAGKSAHTDNWARLRVPNVYAGIDLVYDARRSGFELSFLIAPRTSPERIQMRFRGARRIAMDAAGDLLLETRSGVLRVRHPIVYQPGASGSGAVRAAFRLTAGIVGFDLGPYDRSKPLIIDPVVTLSSFLGGSGFDSANAVAVDAAGAIYITGETDSAVFPGATGSDVWPSREAFVCKLSKDGSTLLYTTILSGKGRDTGQAIAVDASGSVLVAGVTSGGSFPVTPGAAQTIYGGLEDGFVARLGPNGQIVYATYLGGPGSDVATGVGLDQTGNAYVSGYTSSLHFPTTATAPQRVYGGGAYDGFVAKLNATGGLVYSTLVGGSGNDAASSLAVGSDGSACVAGRSDSKNLALVNPVQMTAGGGGKVFVGCLNSAGSAWRQLTYLGGVSGMSADGANAIAVDGAGAVYIAGSASTVDFPTTAGAYQRVNRGAYDAFAAKLSASGSLVYSTLIGGGGSDTASSIGVDANGRAWVAGYTNSFDFPNTGLWAGTPGGGGMDGFVCLLSADGGRLLDSGYLAGAADDRALGIAMTGKDSAVVVGRTNSTDFPTTAGVLLPSAPASYNGFLLQVSEPTVKSVAGDFDGNGTPDLVWQNDVTREVGVWFMGGSRGTIRLGGSMAATGSYPGRTLASVADFDRNGCPDLVWQDDASYQISIWYMGGSQCMTVIGEGSPAPGSYPEWILRGAADFDGNGVPDLIWQNQVTREVEVWFMSGVQGGVLLGTRMAATGNYAGWKIAAVADLNRDGVPDLVWQTDVTREVGVWYMGGPKGMDRLTGAMVATGNYAGWTVVGAADFNQDGVPDLVWQNDVTREVGVWFMGGALGTDLLGVGMAASGNYAGWHSLISR